MFGFAVCIKFEYLQFPWSTYSEEFFAVVVVFCFVFCGGTGTSSLAPFVGGACGVFQAVRPPTIQLSLVDSTAVCVCVSKLSGLVFGDEQMSWSCLVYHMTTPIKVHPEE